MNANQSPKSVDVEARSSAPVEVAVAKAETRDARSQAAAMRSDYVPLLEDFHLTLLTCTGTSVIAILRPWRNLAHVDSPMSE